MNRISKLILYFFYKNFVFTMIHFFFSFNNLSSGQTLIDDWYITSYNLIFTAFPLVVAALTDLDIGKEYKQQVKNCLPVLYVECRDLNRIFSFKNFIIIILRSTISSMVIYYTGLSENPLDIKGNTCNIWYDSIVNYLCIIIIVSVHLLINTNFISFLLPIVMVITTFFFLFIFLILVHYGLIFEFNSKASIIPSFSYFRTYLSVVFGCTISFVLDYSFKACSVFFQTNLTSSLGKKISQMTDDQINLNVKNEDKLEFCAINGNYEKECSSFSSSNNCSCYSLKSKISVLNKDNYINLIRPNTNKIMEKRDYFSKENNHQNFNIKVNNYKIINFNNRNYSNIIEDKKLENQEEREKNQKLLVLKKNANNQRLSKFGLLHKINNDVV